MFSRNLESGFKLCHALFYHVSTRRQRTDYNGHCEKQSQVKKCRIPLFDNFFHDYPKMTNVSQRNFISVGKLFFKRTFFVEKKIEFSTQPFFSMKLSSTSNLKALCLHDNLQAKSAKLDIKPFCKKRHL